MTSPTDEELINVDQYPQQLSTSVISYVHSEL